MVGAMETYFVTHATRGREQFLDAPFEPVDFLRSWTENVKKDRPSSILIVSAHWDTPYPTVNIISGLNDTIYDIPSDFHESFYKLKYPAPGAPEVAKRVKEVLMASGFDRVDEDTTRGLDHGAWIPLSLMYPEANIPVFQLSIQSHKDATYHYNLGKALAPLKEELGVLIISSGNATNNLEELAKATRGDPIAPWAMEFDTWLMDALLQGRYEDVTEFAEKAPHAKMAHPSLEHLYPLHVAMGAAGVNSKAELIYHSWDDCSLSFASYRFTYATPALI